MATNRFFASVVGPAPRFIICAGCLAASEIVLGTYRGERACVRCFQPAEIVAQGVARETIDGSRVEEKAKAPEA